MVTLASRLGSAVRRWLDVGLRSPEPTSPQLGRLAAKRVALVTTSLIAVAYAVISIAVVSIITARLTSEVDTQLADTVHRVVRGAETGPPGVVGDRGQAALQPLVWFIDSNGGQYSYLSGVKAFTGDVDQVPLPSSAVVSAGPKTLSLNGTDYRIASAPVPGEPWVVGIQFDARTETFLPIRFAVSRVVVAEQLTTVNSARANAILAEAVIGPVLLVVVFLGALAIGRRVAAPLEQARRSVMDFTADASHELRTPLSVIEAQSYLALSRNPDPAWKSVQNESRRIRRIVEDLLWLARLDATDNKTLVDDVDLGILATQAADRFSSIAEARRLKLSVDVPATSAIVRVPVEWVDRLLGVLLDNACKYSPAGSTVGVVVSVTRNRCQVTVNDSGPGIPSADRQRIFERFHRATDMSGGAGLGLAIADAVVRSTGGTWHVGDSEEGGTSIGVSWHLR